MPTDAEIIKSLGGPSRVARLLNDHSSKSRVANWIKRGIPTAMKVKHPDLFMPHLRPVKRSGKSE